jgi:hypothetical protein
LLLKLNVPSVQEILMMGIAEIATISHSAAPFATTLFGVFLQYAACK